MGIMKKLSAIQAELNVPKNQRNDFAEFNYRSCEDIFEAIKPLLGKYGVALICGDELQMMGERYYIKATATLIDTDDDTSVSNTAYARENESRPKMDVAQVTGTASSYARKYALNGLFILDDNKDVDGMNNAVQAAQSASQVEKPAELVRNINGQTCAIIKGKPEPLEGMNATQLKWVLTQPAYTKCHAEAARLLNAKGGAA